MQRAKPAWIVGGATAVIAMMAAGALLWNGVVASSPPRPSPHVPVPPVPAPALPNPNAWDFYVKAGQGITLADEKDIYAVLDSSVATLTKTRYGGPLLSLAEQEAVVQRKADSLRLLRQGFAHTYRHPPVRSFSPSREQNHSRHYPKFRLLARLLIAEGNIRAAHGNWDGAANSYLDGIRLGVDVPRGAPLLGFLVGGACERMARRDLWGAVSHLNAAQARAATGKLEWLSLRRVSYVEALQEEKRMIQAAISEVKSNKDGVQFFPPQDEHRLLVANARYMDALVAHARTPYVDKQPPPLVPKELVDTSGQSILAPNFTWPARFQCGHDKAASALLMTTLALHAFDAVRGRYPQALSQLIPIYLKSTPTDPFARQAALRYQRTDAGYVLYSIGPDGKDDGGEPISKVLPATALRLSSQSYMVEQDSRGDIVPGINK